MAVGQAGAAGDRPFGRRARRCGLLRSAASRPGPLQAMIGWFGIRGIGSVYYLSFAITHGLEPGLASTLASLTLGLVAASVLVHGISVTPVMAWYERQTRGRPTEAVRGR